MNFKSIGFKAAIATAVVAGSALSMAPAEAGNLFPGAFTIQGNSSITATTPTDNEFTINFNNFSIAGSTPFSSAPSGVFGGGRLSGHPFVGMLGLKRVGAVGTTLYDITSGLDGFVTGLKKDGKALVLNLASGSQLNGSIQNTTDQYSFDGDLIATLAYAAPYAPNSAPAQTGVGAFRFRVLNGNISQVSVTTIPTPALLPGLLGLGVAALRKRKSEESEVEATETAKA